MPGQQSPAPDFNQRVIDEFRASGGIVGGIFQGTPLILITTEGRLSHRPRVTPVTYLRDGGRYLIFGSNLGRPAHPGWYHNLLARPQVTMETGTGDGHVRTLSARAAVLNGTERDRLYQRQCAISPAFADYRERTSRTIPVVALYPLDLSQDSERNRLIGEQLIAHHTDLRTWLSGIRAQLAAAHDGGTARDSAGPGAPDLAAQLRRHCLSYCHGLELHHIRENGTFTAFEQQFPHLAPVITRLRSEHRTMAEALAGLETLLAATGSGDIGEVLAALDKAATGLEEHFAYEEEHLLPVLRQAHPAR
jgi:deazaflavin-dependent oxidoreductase (nitroreductase family)